MTGPTYIRDGRVSRSKPSSTIYWSRCLLILLIFVFLIVTNPSNGFGHWIPDEYWNTVEWDTSSSWLGYLLRPQDTNYGLFLLTKSIDGISVTGLLNTIAVCKFDSEDELVGHMCGWIDDTFCHGKPLLDWNDLPYTTNRLFCWVLLGIMLLPLCVDREGSGRSRNTIVSSLVSVVDEPTIWDLIQANMVVYPALVNIDRLLQTYLVFEGKKWHFFSAFFVLLFVIGGIGNQIGSWIQRGRRLRGLGAACAACLGYYRATGMSTWSLFRFVDTPFTASTIFWLNASMLLLQQRPGYLVAWISGGMAGHIFGHMHRQWLAEGLRSNASAALYKTIQSFLNF